MYVSNPMSMKLSILCDRIIEAGWLIALIVTPLLFNVFSNSTFELDKVAVLRSIAIVMMLAWMIKGLEKWRVGAMADRGNSKPARALRDRWQRLRQFVTAKPVPFLAAGLLSAYGLATVTSIAPRLSLWGSYQRFEGLYTTGVYFIIFFSILARLRTREQIDRLITTVLLVSFPISLYGILQHFGLDPLQWGWDVSTRVTSTLGNPIFLAAFLIMVVPLTLYRILEAGRETARASINQIGCYFVLLSTQLICVFFTQSRGPWLGLMAGLFFFALLLAAVRHKKKWTALITGTGIAVILALVLISLPNSPLQFMRKVPYLSRMSEVFDSSGRVRLLIWQGAAQLVAAEPKRALIGYGPETMFIAFSPYYDPELRRLEGHETFPDRSHNETFDALVTTGFIGCTIYLLLFAGLIYGGMKSLGLIRSNVQRKLFFGLCFIESIGAMLLAYAVDHSWRFWGIALPLGILAGMFAYLAGYGLKGIIADNKAGDAEALHSIRLLVIGLLAAIVAHFVEIHFGIAVAATRVSFWAYVGMLIAIVRSVSVNPSGTMSPAINDSPTDRLRPTDKNLSADVHHASLNWKLVAMSALASLVMITMAYGFLFSPLNQQRRFSILALFILTWSFAGLIVLMSLTRDKPGRGLSTMAIYASLTVPSLFLFVAVQKAIMQPQMDVGNLPVPYFIALFLIFAVTAGALLFSEQMIARAKTGAMQIAAAGLAAAVASFVIADNLDVVAADIYFKHAKVKFHEKGKYDEAIALYLRALEFQPEQDFYRLFLGKALAEKGGFVQQPREREALFLEAERSLEKAGDLNPLNVDHTANLARLYHLWAQSSGDSGQKAGYFQQALSSYEQAIARCPGSVVLWQEWGYTYFLMGSHKHALEKYQQALTLDSTFAPAHLRLGELYRAESKWQEAARAYERAIAYNDTSIVAHSGLGEMYARLGRIAEAVRENQRTLELDPENLITHTNLALLYRHLGEAQPALRHAQKALAVTAPGKRAALEKFIAQLRAPTEKDPRSK